MRGKKEDLRRGTRQGLPAGDDLQLLRLILEEQPRLKDRVIRFIEVKLGKAKDEPVRAPSQSPGQG